MAKSKKKSLAKNEKFCECVERIANEINHTKKGDITTLEIISRRIVNGSANGDPKMLQLFVEIMKAQQLKVEQYNFELPQFVYNIKVQ
ncbi:MAG: hypothetical protein J6R32_06230 [Bacteroidales bacterium]|nr:hypothetical protein [Bacteroidales bacterium]